MTRTRRRGTTGGDRDVARRLSRPACGRRPKGLLVGTVRGRAARPKPLLTSEWTRLSDARWRLDLWRAVLAAGVEGTVVLDVVVAASGRVASVKVVSGPSELAPDAVSAVRCWSFPRVGTPHAGPIGIDYTLQEAGPAVSHRTRRRRTPQREAGRETTRDAGAATSGGRGWAPRGPGVARRKTRVLDLDVRHGSSGPAERHPTRTVSVAQW